MTMKAIVYANGSSSIGLGHVMRTLAISNELKKMGFIVEYISDESDDNTIRLIKSCGFSVMVKDNILDFISKTQGLKYDVAIVDSYDVNEYEINQFYNISNRVVYIDDLAVFNEYNIDILINTSIDALNINYFGKSKKLLGPKYAILRDEFRNVEYKTPRFDVKKIMITLGGGYVNNITKGILDTLIDSYHDIEYFVVLGSSYRYKDLMLKNYKQDNINFYTDVRNMKDVMVGNDLVISAGGNTLYELCACGIPTIAVIIADNQKKFVGGINKKTGMPFIDLTEASFANAKYNFLAILNKVIKDHSFREKISMEMFQLVDGEGCSRIAYEIIRLI